MYIHLPDVMNPMHIKHMIKEFLPLIHNTVGVCEQIIILILDNMNSRLVTFLKFISYLAI